MQHFRSLATVIVAASTLILGSCNSGKDKKADENKTDSTDTQTVTTVNPSGPTSIMIVRHKVSDYSTWKTGYDSHDSNRLASGLHSYVIARGTEDSNLVLVALKMDDVEKARAFASSPDLKNRMKEIGVTGTPVIDFLESVMNDTTAIQETVRVMIRQKVKDWDAWKKVFDSHKQTRIDAGLSDRVIAHSVGDNHNVTLVFSINDMEKAKAFMNSQDLKDKMKEAGAEGAPDTYFYKVVQRY